jgi:hypothetical protein
LPLPNSQSNSANNSIHENAEKINSTDERKSKNRLYDPKNDKDFTFEEVSGGILMTLIQQFNK